jgi:hypothetical protein
MFPDSGITMYLRSSMNISLATQWQQSSLQYYEVTSHFWSALDFLGKAGEEATHTVLTHITYQLSCTIVGFSADSHTFPNKISCSKYLLP